MPCSAQGSTTQQNEEEMCHITKRIFNGNNDRFLMNFLPFFFSSLKTKDKKGRVKKYLSNIFKVFNLFSKGVNHKDVNSSIGS